MNLKVFNLLFIILILFPGCAQDYAYNGYRISEPFGDYYIIFDRSSMAVVGPKIKKWCGYNEFLIAFKVKSDEFSDIAFAAKEGYIIVNTTTGKIEFFQSRAEFETAAKAYNIPVGMLEFQNIVEY